MKRVNIKSSKDIRRFLLENDMKQIDLIPYIQQKNPGMNIRKEYSSLALAGRYERIYNQILEIINEFQEE